MPMMLSRRVMDMTMTGIVCESSSLAVVVQVATAATIGTIVAGMAVAAWVAEDPQLSAHSTVSW